MKKYKVRCTYEIEIELHESINPKFYIEDNGCPGTGAMGLELENMIEESNLRNTCWACCHNGKCEIIDSD